MYGFCEDTYAAVTKKNLYRKVIENILKLKENGINVLLKMFVVKENYEDFRNVQSFSIEQGIPFKYDSMIITSNNSEEKNHQISEECITELLKKEIITAPKYNELFINLLWVHLTGNFVYAVLGEVHVG